MTDGALRLARLGSKDDMVVRGAGVLKREFEAVIYNVTG